MKKILVAALSLMPTSLLAHAGHLTNESVHSFLHIEHIVAIVAIALIIYLVKSSE